MTLSGVNGTERIRAPVASNTAFAMAAGIAQAIGSPAPHATVPGRSISATSTFGASVFSDFTAEQADFLRDVGEWVRTGRLKYREDIVDGLGKAPASFLGVLQGKNFGKMLVRIAT